MRVHINGTIEEVSDFLGVQKENIVKPVLDDLYKINDIDFMVRNVVIVHCGETMADMMLEEVKVYGK